MILFIDGLINIIPENSADFEDDSTVGEDHNNGRKDENNKQLKKTTNLYLLACRL